MTLAATNTNYFAIHLMIWTDNCGLLNHVQRICFLKALKHILLTKKGRAHCNLAKFSIRQCSFMPQLGKAFPAKFLKSWIHQTSLLAPFYATKYDIMLVSVSPVVSFPSISARSSSLCGNYQLDEGEQCDGGRTTLDGRDPCCTEECQLKAGSVCRSAEWWVGPVVMVTTA